jgi:hypothetical protein
MSVAKQSRPEAGFQSDLRAHPSRRIADAVKATQAESPVVELCACILKNFASARSYLATLRADVAPIQQSTVASYG